MRSEQRSSLGYASKWLPYVFAAIAAAALLLITRVQPEPIVGDVLRVREGTGGTLFATVEFVDDRGDQPAVVVAELELPPELEDASQVPIWTGNEHSEPRIGRFGYIEITPSLIVVTAIVAALLGKVVELTIRGYGYVPGTGEPGQTPPEHVAEDRGFYWRT